MKLLFQLCLLVLFSNTFGQPAAVDLKDQWLLYRDGTYVPFEDNADAKTVYLRLSKKQYRGRVLTIESSQPVFLFINGKITGAYSSKIRFDLDSLREIYYQPTIVLALHQKKINPRDLSTQLEGSRVLASEEAPFKPRMYFRDFIIVAGLLIIVYFVIISRLNPKLTNDYLSVGRIFSVRETDDSQSSARLTSSMNVQFLIFTSLLCAFGLLIIFQHLPEDHSLPLAFQASGFFGTVGQWLKLSAILLMIFLSKIMIIYSLTRLFGMWGLARIHFFNWIRLILLFSAIACIILFTYYIWHGQNPKLSLVFLKIIAAILIAWIVLVFLKLNGKTEHSMFHLFSYICATEIIPLLIIIKVLFQ